MSEDQLQRRMLNLSEVSSMLGIDRRLLAREAMTNKLPFPVFRVGARYLVPYAAINQITGGQSVPALFSPERRTLRLDEVARLLGVSRSTLYKHARDGLLPFPMIQIGERMVVPYVVVEKLLAGEYIEPTWLAPQDEHEPITPAYRSRAGEEAR